ncbi:MAG: prepilin-type N-terminal cleavage/methylation domain-containing protein [Candidatus Woesebacteria bacterium]|jgi:prepilin-type N-terminal cleavage/methylation domain-containing protein
MVKTKPERNQGGLTLIEVLVAMVVMAALGAGLLSLQYILGQNQLIVFENYLSVDEANANVASFIREVRMARHSENAAYPIEVAQDNQVVFYSDYDFDNETERVRYTLTDNRLEKGIIEPTGNPTSYPSTNEKVKLLSENVRNAENPAFYYYNENWPNDTTNNPLAESERLSDTRTIRIYLRLNPDPDEPNRDYILDSFSQIRMLKENL